MKRIVMALPLAAASVLTCSLAFAQGTVEPTDIKSEAWKHIVVTVIAGLLPPLIKALNEGTQQLPTLAQPFRLVIIGVLGFIAAAVEQWGTGLDIVNVLVTLAMTMGPSLLIELVHVLWGGWPKGDIGPGGKFGIMKSNRPPSPRFFPPALMLVLAVGLTGCAAKPYICPIIETAGELCNFLVVRLPDGSTEQVPKSAVIGMAMSARTARFEAAKAGAADAGADR